MKIEFIYVILVNIQLVVPIIKTFGGIEMHLWDIREKHRMSHNVI